LKSILPFARLQVSELNTTAATATATHDAARACEDEKKAKIGMIECVKHGVLQPYDMLLEKEGAFVVQCKMQVILTASGTLRVTEAPLPVSFVKSDHKVKDKALFQLINSSLSGKKKKTASKDAVSASPLFLLEYPLLSWILHRLSCK
jgi:hypothetical protein